MRLEDRKGQILVVKIGGSTLGSHDTTLEDLVALQRAGGKPVVVHGGGEMITQWLARHGLPTRFVKGLRVTDADSLQVAVAVLAGWINTDIVCSLQRLGGEALGLAGTDGRLLLAEAKDPSLGYVGQVEAVNAHLIRLALAGGYVPVIAPIGLGPSGQALNINADTVAGEIAATLGAEALFFLTDVAGVCDERGNCLSTLESSGVGDLLSRGIISGGMIPKVEACLRAVRQVGQARILDGRIPHALLEALGDAPTGTQII